VLAVEPGEAMTLVASNALMIDVRDEKEWQAGHAVHSIHIPLPEISNATTFTTRTRRVILVSRSGRRAFDAMTHLRAAGVDAVILKGGLHAWRAAGGEIVADGGKDPRIT
jgi:rhodanese-related sulfurtransferase